MNLNKSSRSYYPALDGLRGLAIIMVILYHNFHFINNFFFTWLGVDLFFVLSGYLITTILLKSVNSPHYLKNFYMKRVLRIFPLYYLALVIFLVIFPLFGDHRPDLQFYVNHQWWFWLYAENWLLSFQFPPPGPNVLNHFWSLAVEEQFYLIWPFVILLIRKPGKLLYCVLSLLLLLLFVRSIIWMKHFPGVNYTTLYTFTRIDGICIGCITALVHQINYDFLRKNMSVIVIALAIMNFGFYFINQSGNFPYLAFVGYTTFAAMFGLLVHEAVSGDTRIITLVFSNPVLRFFGLISYGLYVFHWPVYSLTQQYFHNFLTIDVNLSEKMSAIGSSLIATLLAILLSVISYYTFELKFLKLKEKFR